MNETRPAQRRAPSAQPNRRPQSPQAKRRAAERRRRQRRRFTMFLVIHQILLILIAGGIGYLLGRANAPEPASDPVETQPPAQTTAPADQAAPSVPADSTPPTILGVNPMSVFIGSTIAYRSGILVSDDCDPAPKLSVDTFQVNLSAPGVYPVFYTATDASGNTTTLETTVTVKEAPDTYVDEAIINETADKLLEKILTEGMTKEEQINAIYDYIESHCYYIADFDKSDYMQAAYLMMTNNRGDCYGFYAVSRLLFDRLGLENLSVTRLKNEVRTSGHYWNMVSLDGGESWYHFDATPHMTYPTRTCLVTDADLEAFNELMPNYYYYDHAAFPRTPTA